MFRRVYLVLWMPLLTKHVARAFVSMTPRTTTLLSMVPRFDPATEKWYPSQAEEEASAGYGPTGTLLRAGPKPFLQRVFSPEQYDQAVLKYMARDRCSRNEAQGNMDAYFENPMGESQYSAIV